MQNDISLSISEIMNWEIKCLIKLCETLEENKLTFRELLSIQLSAGRISSKEYDFCLFSRALGQMILRDEIESRKLAAAYRNYLSVSLEVSRIFNKLKLEQLFEQRARILRQHRQVELAID